MITAIIQARVRSRRLPNKVLLSLNGKTVLENVIERVQKSKYIEDVIVATTTERSDDKIVELCERRSIKYFRGSEDDVLDRYCKTAKAYKVQHICRITADCPLIDPFYISLAAKRYLEEEYDYVGINRPLDEASYPDGLDTEIFSFKTLEKIWRDAKLPSEREHVTSYIWEHPEKFRIYSFKSKADLSHYRFTLDEPKDYQLIKFIYAQVKPLTTRNIIRFIDTHKNMRKLNAKIKRDEGYYKSLSLDSMSKP